MTKPANHRTAPNPGLAKTPTGIQGLDEITGGGLPVEIWSKFMKPAHHGVAVIGLPGFGDAPAIASLLPSFARPSAAVPHADAQAQPQQTGLDNWLIDRLFGRR